MGKKVWVKFDNSNLKTLAYINNIYRPYLTNASFDATKWFSPGYKLTFTNFAMVWYIIEKPPTKYYYHRYIRHNIDLYIKKKSVGKDYHNSQPNQENEISKQRFDLF